MADEHEHGDMNEQQLVQIFQQKIGNLELTVNALIGVLIDDDVIEQDTLNDKAQEIVEQLQEQQQAAHTHEDVAEQLEEE